MRARLSRQALHLVGCGFVDNTDIMQIGLEDDDYPEVAIKLQEALSWWETCTKVSGGVIVPKKNWYVLAFLNRQMVVILLVLTNYAICTITTYFIISVQSVICTLALIAVMIKALVNLADNLAYVIGLIEL